MREAASLEATASILHNFTSCDNDSFLDGFLEQMELFFESNKYNYRQTFICMIESIFLDFCQDKDSSLINSIVIGHFKTQLVTLSTDRVVNVRL